MSDAASPSGVSRFRFRFDLGGNAAMTKIRESLFALLVLLTLIAITNQSSWAGEKTAKLSPVRIGYVSRSILDMPFMIARDRGLFRKRVWSLSSFSSRRLKPYQQCWPEALILAQQLELPSPPR
jgi:hypothetical protein